MLMNYSGFSSSFETYYISIFFSLILYFLHFWYHICISKLLNTTHFNYIILRSFVNDFLLSFLLASKSLSILWKKFTNKSYYPFDVKCKDKWGQKWNLRIPKNLCHIFMIYICMFWMFFIVVLHLHPFWEKHFPDVVDLSFLKFCVYVLYRFPALSWGVCRLLPWNERYR